MNSIKTKIPIFDRESKEERDYWRARLSRGISLSNLRLDYPRPALYSSGRESVTLKLSDELVGKLTRITGDSPFLIYAALLAALKICLHKYTGSTSIVTGSPCRQKD